MSTYDEVTKQIAEFATTSFAQHELTVLGAPTEAYPRSPTVYRVATPGTNVYAFNVMCAPGAICVWGDLGDWVLSHSSGDSVSWLRGALESPGYFISKIRAGDKDEFYPDEAHNLLDEWLKDPENSPYDSTTLNIVKDEVDGILRREDLCREDWTQAWFDANADEAPDCEFPSSGALWLIEALKCLIRLLDKVSP